MVDINGSQVILYHYNILNFIHVHAAIFRSKNRGMFSCGSNDIQRLLRMIDSVPFGHVWPPINVPSCNDAVCDFDSGGPKETCRVHIGTTWRTPLNCPCAAAMRFVVKLLWPPVIIIIDNPQTLRYRRTSQYTLVCIFPSRCSMKIFPCPAVISQCIFLKKQIETRAKTAIMLWCMTR